MQSRAQNQTHTQRSSTPAAPTVDIATTTGRRRAVPALALAAVLAAAVTFGASATAEAWTPKHVRTAAVAKPKAPHAKTVSTTVTKTRKGKVTTVTTVTMRKGVPHITTTKTIMAKPRHARRVVVRGVEYLVSGKRYYRYDRRYGGWYAVARPRA